MDHDTQSFGQGRGMTAVLILRFLLELALLAGVAFCTWTVSEGAWRWLLALGSVIVVATFWGVSLSPKAIIPPPPAVRFSIEAVLFLGVSLWLFLLEHQLTAVVFAAVWVAHRVFFTVLQRRKPTDRKGKRNNPSIGHRQ